MLTKEYQQDYTGEFKVSIHIKNGNRVEKREWCPNQIEYTNTSFIGLCIQDTDLPLHHLKLEYPTFSINDDTNFTVHDKFYTHLDLTNVIPFKPMFTQPGTLLYVSAFHKFETLFMFGLNATTEKQQQHVNEVLKVYNDTEFVLVSGSGYADVAEIWKYNLNFHQIDWRKFKTLVQ